ncbi:unnamed protein product [Adineta steineri]|uniref:Small ribosomal subunit protein uS7 domain-containing protein n=5 Tax=Bdelloidea TaxID=44578 RepID=A0A813YF41_9BILA|nr:unnamed protein product [Adineta steineri]
MTDLMITDDHHALETTATDIRVFGKWSGAEVQISDMSLEDYILGAKQPKFLPHSAGRYQVKRFRKASCPIVERLVCSLMFHGRNNGKKLMAVRIVRHTFEIIHLLSGENPLQVLVNAIINSGPREDSTRIGRQGTVRRQAVDVSPLRRNPLQVLVNAIINSGPREDSTRIGRQGTVRRQAVDVSPLRRVNQSLYLLCTGARDSAFKSVKTIAECLADELINAAKGSSTSFAIKRKDELERNPLQVLVNAIINSGPREDSTRIGRQGTVRRQAVDVSPLRRVNQSLYLLCTGARDSAFKSVKTIAECLADELINAAKGSSTSFAIKRKDELERVAKSNR